jgi:hypothetical protein
VKQDSRIGQPRSCLRAQFCSRGLCSRRIPGGKTHGFKGARVCSENGPPALIVTMISTSQFSTQPGQNKSTKRGSFGLA